MKIVLNFKKNIHNAYNIKTPQSNSGKARLVPQVTDQKDPIELRVPNLKGSN